MYTLCICILWEETERGGGGGRGADRQAGRQAERQRQIREGESPDGERGIGWVGEEGVGGEGGGRFVRFTNTRCYWSHCKTTSKKKKKKKKRTTTSYLLIIIGTYLH